MHTCRKDRQVPAWEGDAPFVGFFIQAGKLRCLEQCLIIPPMFAQILEFL